MTTILVVDDEKSILNFVRKNLEARHYRVLTAQNGAEALQLFQKQTVHLVILDIMMPQMDGLTVLRQIRKRSTVPVIILSALDDEVEKVQAFDIGADDYLTKPFGVGELMGRVKAVLRRSQWQDVENSLLPDEMLEVGPFKADITRHSIWKNGMEIPLTPTEFKLMIYLMRNAGKVLPHQMILKAVWGPEYGREAEYLRVYMGRLRQKLEDDPMEPRHLLTERGIGYRLEP
jgi:two-component system KDP operon response regulator KdpE